MNEELEIVEITDLKRLINLESCYIAYYHQKNTIFYYCENPNCKFFYSGFELEQKLVPFEFKIDTSLYNKDKIISFKCYFCNWSIDIDMDMDNTEVSNNFFVSKYTVVI